MRFCVIGAWGDTQTAPYERARCGNHQHTHLITVSCCSDRINMDEDQSKGASMQHQSVHWSILAASLVCGLTDLSGCSQSSPASGTAASGGAGGSGGTTETGGMTTTGGATSAGGATTTGVTTLTAPCDIYAAANTPCVAAHSMVRALYGAYNGSLYQVRRLADQTTRDIGVLAPGGFADSAAQDSFCAGTLCTVSIIYDQSPQGNHLTVAPAGGYVKMPDREVIANRYKLTVGGHTVYGAYFDAGMGYRNNGAKGTATGEQPQSMYMVASGVHYNDQCCFDYGNAETTSNNDGNGTMEAIYFGSCSIWSQGAGSGPWVMADLENGMYAGSAYGVNPGNASVHYDYLTGLVKGKPGELVIKAGNAQAGTLQTMHDGARPPGYEPMIKEGAILLGTGGDNSNGAFGIFFEGCMTSAYSSDATDDAIQANIVAAGYGPGSNAASCGPKCTSATECSPNVVPSGLTTLTDFSSNLDSGGIFHTGGVSDWTSLYGGAWVAPTAPAASADASVDPCAGITPPSQYPLAQSFTAGNWHITGTIASGQWAGMGLWFSGTCPVLDLSAYKGLSFTVAGNAGPSGSISVSVSTAANAKPNADWTSSGFTCYSNAATCSSATCSAASVPVKNITETPQTVTLLWTDLSNGQPSATANPAEIAGISFSPTLDFSNNGTSYSLDLTIDDLTLIP